MSRNGTFRQVFSSREYRALWTATLLSDVGDQLARVAVAVIAYERTSSAAVTAVTYALTFVPALIGGPLLGGLADRFPRREVMFCCDLVRAVLAGLMALPGTPLAVLCALLFAVHLLEAPVRASYSAVLPQVLDGDGYVTGLSALQMASQAVRVLGFAVGGVVAAVFRPENALLMDAATFLAAALIVRFGLTARPAPRPPVRAPAPGTPSSPGSRGVATVRMIAGDRRLRLLVASAWLAGFYVTPQALALPYAAALGMGGAGAGVLMAAGPLGALAGVLVLGRMVPAPARLALLGPLTVLTSVPLILVATGPGPAGSVALLALSGLCSAYQVTANAEFVTGVPDHLRGRAVGLAGSGLIAAQGLGMAAGGLLAELTGPGTAITTAGVLGTLAALPLATAWHTRVHSLRRLRHG
ncbi:MFS transporter [Microtetraspora sp. NBRC 13810]|uniref:MFS transporter n=1 Tax=Microtetraspora sp. NBRC 13810 TaxID=3030990 RepID=UPI0024A3AEE9|nr:MFS transporter [Microtetraspora sp. NBRC 13810]GLW05754.1 MFS transporter [Microtetraspora sp. NBRC 13810]